MAEPCPDRWTYCPHGHQDCCGHHDQEDMPLHLPVRNQIEPLSDYAQVVHPQHYQLPGGLEVLDLVEDLSFCLGNAVKYLFRAGKKPGVSAEIDLQKAVYYIEHEITRQRRLKEQQDERKAERRERERTSRNASIVMDEDT
jgi:hypothetical protein